MENTLLKDKIQELKRMMVEAGVYDPTFDPQIKKTARDELITERIFNSCVDEVLTPLTFDELSTKGDIRTKPNPVFEMYAKYSKIVTDNYDKLMLNRKSQSKGPKKSRENELASLMNELKDD